MTTPSDSSPRRSLEGKVALVTGGSRSIGAAVSKRLAADGAAVALTYSASPSEIADFVAYLARPGASFITGASLAVDGGYAA